MAPIRKGDGTPLEIPGVWEVRSGDGRVFFDAIPDSGADHQWNFDGGTGTTVNDSNGGLDADFSSISWQSGIGAGDFVGELDGTDDTGDLGSDSRNIFASLVNEGKGAFSGWFRLDDFNTDLQTLVGNDSSNSDRAFTFWYRDDETVILRVGTSSDGDDTVTDLSIDVSALNEGEWHNFAFTMDGDDVYVLLDGNIDNSASVGATESGDLQSNNVHLGSQGGDQRFVEAGIDICWFDPEPVPTSEISDWVDDTEGLYG